MAKIVATKFKIGDRVRITQSHTFGHPAVGTEFVIEHRDMDWDGFASWYGKDSHPFRYRDDQLEFAGKKPVKKEGKSVMLWIILRKTQFATNVENPIFGTEDAAKRWLETHKEHLQINGVVSTTIVKIKWDETEAPKSIVYDDDEI